MADCAAAAYASLSLEGALKMLKLEGGAPALQAYISKRALPWELAGSRLHFSPQTKPKAAVDAGALITNTLHYATELERIV